MKPPAKNMSTNLRSGTSLPDGVMVQKQTPQSAAGMVIPGEGGVSMAPGEPRAGAATAAGQAVGRIFGGS
jgi:hypothetical protein